MRDQGPNIPFAAISHALLAMAATFVAGILPGGRRQRDEWVVKNPTRADRKAGSFQINLRTGKWIDAATGGSYASCDKGGDLISLYAYVHGIGQGQAAKECARIAGLDMSLAEPAWRRPLPEPVKGEPAPALDRDVEKKIQAARAIWHAAPSERYHGAIAAGGTLVERYLRGRGIKAALPPTLKFSRLRHPSTGEQLHPVMLGRMQEGERFCGVHRTFLSERGGKADLDPRKMMYGQAAGAVVRLSPLSPWLILCEGIETGLAIVDLAPDWTVWAALSAGNLAAVAIPATVADLVIIADADQKFDPRLRAIRRIGMEAAQAACAALGGTGVRTAIVHLPDGMDANDLLANAPDDARQLGALLAGRRHQPESPGGTGDKQTSKQTQMEAA